MSFSTRIMAKDASQDLNLTGTNWNMPSKLHQDVVSSLTLTENVLLDETIEVVKEKVWSFRNACRGLAEALCRIGVSPTVVGYSSVPLHEEGYVKEQDEGMLALQAVDDDDIQRVSYPALLDRGSTHESVPEEDNLLHREEAEEDDVDHGFVETTRKELVETKSLTRSGR